MVPDLQINLNWFVFGFLAWFATAGLSSAASLDFELEQIAPGNYVHYGVHDERTSANLGDNANIGFVVGDRCALIFDAGGSVAVGRELYRALRRVTEKPVCYVVVSHVHPDHVFGVAALLDNQPEVIGHDGLARQMAARGKFYLNALQTDLGDAAKGSELVVPTRTVAAGATLVLDLGGREVEIRGWPPAHTDHDLTMFDRSTSTLWLGDLLFVEHTPVLDSNITGFLGVMNALRDLSVEHYVAGHGRSQLPWPAVMEPQRAYFDVILEQTRQAIRENVRLMDAVNSVGLSEAGKWVNFDTYHRRNVTTAYTELEWEQ